MKKNAFKLAFICFFLSAALLLIPSCKADDDDDNNTTAKTTYTITLNANGGTMTGRKTYKVEIGENWRIPEATELGLSHKTLNFQGWATSAGSSEVTYGDNYLFCPESDLTLYAIWAETKQVTYTVTSSDSLNDIITSIKTLQESKTAYTIYIDGELELTGRISIEDPSEHGTPVKMAEKITIIGKGTEDKLLGSSDTILHIKTQAPVIIKNLTLSNGDGYAPITEKCGGAIYMEGSSASVTLDSGAILSSNKADKGGAVYVSGGTLRIAGAKITENKASSGEGGAIFNDKGTIQITGGEISSNEASFGGAIYTSNELDMSGGTVSGNKATEFGGGIYIKSGTVSLTGGAISKNSATNGGGVFANGGSISAEGTGISENTAVKGAGVFNKASFTLGGGSISYNTATKSESETSCGGGIYNDSEATVLIEGGYVSSNSADNGAGIYNRATFTFNNGFIDSNIASGNGGGIYNSGKATMGTHSLQNGMYIIAGKIEENKADGNGGGIYNADGLFSLNTERQADDTVVFGSISGNTATSGKTWYKEGGTVKIKGTEQNETSSDEDIKE